MIFYPSTELIKPIMLKVSVIGASGYTGAQLVDLVHRHPAMDLLGTYVSENSADGNKSIAAIHAVPTVTRSNTKAIGRKPAFIDFLILFASNLHSATMSKDTFILIWVA